MGQRFTTGHQLTWLATRTWSSRWNKLNVQCKCGFWIKFCQTHLRFKPLVRHKLGNSYNVSQVSLRNSNLPHKTYVPIWLHKPSSFISNHYLNYSSVDYFEWGKVLNHLSCLVVSKFRLNMPVPPYCDLISGYLVCGLQAVVGIQNHRGYWTKVWKNIFFLLFFWTVVTDIVLVYLY